MTQGTVGGSGARRLTRIRGLAAPGRRGWGLRFVLTVLLGLTWTGYGHGAPGDLDPTFGTQGIVTTAFEGFGYLGHMILQPDGNIVVGGQSSFDCEHRLLHHAGPLPAGRPLGCHVRDGWHCHQPPR